MQQFLDYIFCIEKWWEYGGNTLKNLVKNKFGLVGVGGTDKYTRLIDEYRKNNNIVVEIGKKRPAGAKVKPKNKEKQPSYIHTEPDQKPKCPVSAEISNNIRNIADFEKFSITALLEEYKRKYGEDITEYKITQFLDFYFMCTGVKRPKSTITTAVLRNTIDKNWWYQWEEEQWEEESGEFDSQELEKELEKEAILTDW